MKELMSKMAGKAPEKDDKYEAKMSVLNELRDMAMNMMGEKVKSHLPHSAEENVASGYDKKPDSSLPNKKSNGSDMDAAAGEVESRINSFSRHEPKGDQGEPDQSHKNLQYMSKSQGLVDSDSGTASVDHEDEDDMSDEEIDSMMAELQAKKQARKSKA